MQRVILYKAKVELISSSSKVNKWQETDKFGQLTMKGLPEALDYILSVYSPESASYVPYIEMNLDISENIVKSIILNYGYHNIVWEHIIHVNSIGYVGCL